MLQVQYLSSILVAGQRGLVGGTGMSGGTLEPVLAITQRNLPIF